MKYKALLTLDIDDGGDSSKRVKFYEYLKKKNWTKIPDLTTAWKCIFKEGISRDDALKIIKNQVRNAAKESGVSDYHAATQLGEGYVETF